MQRRKLFHLAIITVTRSIFCLTAHLLNYYHQVNFIFGLLVVGIFQFKLLILVQFCYSETRENSSESSSTISSETEVNGRSEVNSKSANTDIIEEKEEPELKLLDLYSGCGAMSTGLCQGGILSGSNIVTVSSTLCI
jgi:hypothetical protein